MSTFGFGKPTDARFNTIWIKGTQLVDQDRKMKVKRLTVKDLNVTGTSNIGDVWTNEELPDSDNASWVPVNNTHYFHTNLTNVPSRKVLTINQASINAAYPDAPDKTMIRFDFPPTLTGSEFDLSFPDVTLFEDESIRSPPNTIDYVYYMHGGYLLKENGVWMAVMPNLNWD